MNVGVRGVLPHTWCLIVIRKFHGFLSWYGSKIQESEWWMSPNANVIAVMSLNSLLTLLSSQSLFRFHGTEWFLPVRIFVSWKKGATSLSASEVQNCMTRLELSWTDDCSVIRSCWNERQPERCVWLLDLLPVCYRKRQFISTTFRSIAMKDCPLNSSIKFYHSCFWLRLTTPQAVNSLGTSQIGLQCAKFCWGSCQGLPRCLSCLDPKGKHWVCHSICCIGCMGLSGFIPLQFDFSQVPTQ